MICKVCKRYFKPKKENRYEITMVKSIADVFTTKAETQVAECFDCPKCGCQNIVNIREK